MLSRIDTLDQITREFNELCRDMDADLLNRKPNKDTWSVAQILDHIIVINNTYFPILDQLEKGTYSPPIHARFGFIVKFFGRFILNSMLPENRKKIKTFPIWEPSNSRLPVGILDAFTAHQEVLKKKMTAAAPFIESGAVIHSPANRIVVYTLDKAFDIIVTHEKRHLQQAREIKQVLFGADL